MSTEHHQLTPNDLQQLKRMILGAFIGFIVPKIFDWNYGVYFAVYPILILGITPFFNAHVARQLLLAGCFNVGIAMIVSGFFQGNYFAVILAIVVINIWCFWLMTSGIAFMAGSMSLLGTHALLHLGSYTSTDLNDLCISHFMAIVTSLISAYLAFICFPDRESRGTFMPPKKSFSEQLRQMTLGASTATLSFLAFMIFDEKDSLAAQAASLLILLPMNWEGIFIGSIHRIVGSLIGSAYAIIIQVLLYTWGDNVILMSLFYMIAVMILSAEHIRERTGPAKGFCAVTGLSIFYGLKTPGTDIFYNSLYRFSSVLVAVILTMMVSYYLSKVINAKS
ncbi:DUF2955 domain-containing protein [Klebsiella variicola]|uniref:DUF2955 domain-containing protein n=1 Tax=Klebsiella variicola TaxID=244366 RepID=UPI001C21E0C1|nr:DUF2955 domain-containing protein [Klebsiella variicola]MBU9731527.1 DUF2955 domain-containing protein [Klebsiella variicola]